MTSQQHSIIDLLADLSGFRSSEQQHQYQQSDIYAKRTGVGRWFIICLACLWLLLGCSLATVSAQTSVSGEITQDTTFGPNAQNSNGIPADTVYIITGDVTVRHSGSWGPVATLTVEPGVELRFEPGTGLYIGYYSYGAYYGALVAQGVTFTSNAVSPAEGDWKGIYFRDQTDDTTSRVEQCTIEYGGHTHNANLSLNHASPAIVDSTIRESSDAGIWVTGSGSTGEIYDSTIEANVIGIAVSSSAAVTIDSSTIQANSQDGITVSWASPTITGNTITGNGGHGISGSLGGTETLVSGNTLSANGGVPLYLHPIGVQTLGNNNGSGNGEDVIKIQGGTITTDTTWKKLAEDAFPYVVSGDITVRHAERYQMATLTVEPGTVLRFEPGVGVTIGYCEGPQCRDHYYGALIAEGGLSEAERITLTSTVDSPQPEEHWKGIYFTDQTDDTTSRLERCDIEYGGQTQNANVYVEDASPMIRHTTITNSRDAGIRVVGSGSAGEIRDNTIEGNVTGIVVSGSAPTIDANTIRQNSQDGISLSASSLAQVSGNTLSDNGGSPIHAHPNSVKDVGSNFGSGNGVNYIKIQGGSITADGTWKRLDTGAFPYVVSGDITVRHTERYQTTTLTVEPGTVLRFEPGVGVTIGYCEGPQCRDHYYGALIAEGGLSEAERITLTSTVDSPQPEEHWKGIYFTDQTDDTTSVLEQCVIEYGGHTHNANLYLEHAAPTLQYNIIQHSSHSGILVNGTGSNGAVIRYNDFTQNPYGVYTTGSAQPAINYNNFVGNTPYGVFNASSSVVVNAEHNWWNDAVNGPNLKGESVSNGDWVSDFVDYDPWEGGDIENSLPFDPHTPDPADGAVNVPLDAGTVTLSWVGGDPDAWDSVEYNVYWGLAADTLTNVGTTNPDEAQFVKDSVAEGTTYFWQIVARDTAGATATSPVWQFTTQGQPPDLIVSGITWEPAADIEADQQVTFTATIQNVGAGPVVDAFQVEFQVDSASLGTVPVDPILYPNDSVTLTHTWTAVAGSHTITVVADSTDTVFEDTNESNNDHAETLEVLDVLPPEVVSLVPEDGASLQQLTQIVITLADQHGTVDDAAVIASIEVRDSSSQPVAGTVSESNDSFTFTPDLSPFADGTYTLSFTAKDIAGNEQLHTTSFTIDAAPPAAPTITGGTVNPSGQIQERPFDNQSTSSAILLTGTREDNTSVWINNALKVMAGSGDWAVNLPLAQGDNALEIFLKDEAGNPSDSVWVDIFVDSVAPAITSLDPADGSFLTTAPASVMIVYQEVTSGINWSNSVLTLTDGSMTAVPGNWDTSVADQITFTPDAGFTEETYTLEVRLEDVLGNSSPLTQTQFTVDAQPPAAPTITGGEVLSGPIQERPFQNQSTGATVTLTGTREENTSVWINSEQQVAVGSGEWSVDLSLHEGDHELEIFLLDQADNPSDSVWVDMFVDSVAPAITAVTPEEDSFLNAAPATVVIEFQEATSGLDLASSVSVLRDGSMAEVAGTWQESGGSQLVCTPDAPLVESAYTVVLQLTDQLGNQGLVVQSHFTVDTTPPADPVVNSVSPVQNPQQVISGTKEAHAAILLIEGQNDTEIVSHTPSTTWQYPVMLVEGDNPFTFKARDRAGNDSGEVPITITYTDTPPLPVSTLTVNGVGDGTQAILNWNDSDNELLHGDIVSYRIYAETSDFTDVSGLTEHATVNAGTFSYTLENLSKGATYWFAVLPVDAGGKIPVTISTVSEPLTDTVAPEEVTNLQVQCFADRIVFT